jgi:hypothetical protein
MEGMIMSRELIKKTIECEHCKKSYSFEVRENGLEAWENGEYIQDALYDLTAGQRELLTSSICGKCFDELFGS